MNLSGPYIMKRMKAEGLEGALGPGDAAALIERFAGEVALWGSRTHLVGRSKQEENILVSILDSLHLLGLAEASGDRGPRRGRRVADIGSGAGFPGIVWAIARPDMEIALFERREKPRIFLERTAALLGLRERVEVHGEADGSGPEEGFDLVVSKAAGRLEVIVPIARRLLAEGGLYLTIKGEGWEEEKRDAEMGMMSLEAVEELPGGRGTMLGLRKAHG